MYGCDWKRGSAVLVVVLTVLCGSAAGVAVDAEGPSVVVSVWPGDPPGEPALGGAMPEEEDAGGGRLRFVSSPTLTVYLPDAELANGAAVVVCPGGGYGILAMNHEGHDVARWLNDQGIAAIVLKYRHYPYRHPVPMHDAQRAMRLVRHHAEQWGIDPERVGIMGFSAGGHLASTVATHHDRGDPDHDDPVERQSCRPDFAILVYPVIATIGEHAHRGSRHNLLGRDATDEQAAELNNHEHVDAQTPPTFLAHARDDGAVPLANSEMFLLALEEAGVAGELAVQERGGHGFGLGDVHAEEGWPMKCIAWLEAQGFLEAGQAEAE